jgi:hypothetical protein
VNTSVYDGLFLLTKIPKWKKRKNMYRSWLFANKEGLPGTDFGQAEDQKRSKRDFR